MDSILENLSSNGALTLTLNRPDKLNALNQETLLSLEDILNKAKNNRAVKGLIITGAGKAFCAGADLNELNRADTLTGYEFALLGQRVFQTLESLGKPSLALVNGFALGGGCELLQACTIRIASIDAKFGQPEVKLGVIPGYGGTQRLARLVGKGRALDLCLTGKIIDANCALAFGLVTEVIAKEELLPRGEALMTSLLALAPLAQDAIMSVINQGYDLPLADALKLEALHFARLCATKDKAEGVKAFLEKRQANFYGA